MKKLVIVKDDLKHNIEKIKEHAKEYNPTIIAVVKSNGYGLGIVELTNFLIDNGITNFAVATVEEAIKLRQAGIKEKIIILSSTAIKEDIEILVDNDITLTIGSKEAAEAAQEVAKEKNKKVKAHLKIDTGFGRYGFLYTNPQEIIDTINNLENVEIDGTFTHFSVAFYEKSNHTQIQFERFMNVVKKLKENNIQTGMLHVCNSAAFIRFPKMHLDAVRIGSALVGKLPFETGLGLKKIGTLTTKVAEIKTLPKGFNVSYSNVYTTKKETQVAIVPLGYIDGVNVTTGKDMFRKVDKLRRLFNDFKSLFRKEAIYVTIAGKKCEVLGTVGTFHMTVDITGKEIKVGDKVEVTPMITLVNSDIRREYV